MPATALTTRPDPDRTTPAERAAAERITAECAEKQVRRVTTEWLMTQPKHACAYGKKSQPKKPRNTAAAKARGRAEAAWGRP